LSVQVTRKSINIYIDYFITELNKYVNILIQRALPNHTIKEIQQIFNIKFKYLRMLRWNLI